MRRIIVTLLIGFCMGLTSAQAQQVVIDPSQIAASATNAANQIDYMLDQLEELAHLGDQMNTMREHIDNVFGEDGIAGDPTSEQVFIRIGEAFLAAMVAINIIARLFNINL